MTTSPALNSNSSQVAAVVTDPTNYKTTYRLDSLGRETQLKLPDTTTQSWTLNSAGLPTVYTGRRPFPFGSGVCFIQSKSASRRGSRTPFCNLLLSKPFSDSAWTVTVTLPAKSARLAMAFQAVLKS